LYRSSLIGAPCIFPLTQVVPNAISLTLLRCLLFRLLLLPLLFPFGDFGVGCLVQKKKKTKHVKKKTTKTKPEPKKI
jgi:hypothetical protein